MLVSFFYPLNFFCFLFDLIKKSALVCLPWFQHHLKRHQVFDPWGGQWQQLYCWYGNFAQYSQIEWERTLTIDHPFCQYISEHLSYGNEPTSELSEHWNPGYFWIPWCVPANLKAFLVGFMTNWRAVPKIVHCSCFSVNTIQQCLWLVNQMIYQSFWSICL